MHLTKQVTAQKYWLEVINDYNIEPVTEQQQAAILLGRVIYRTVEINQSIKSLTNPIVPAIGRTTPPRASRFRERALVTPDTDERVPAEACLRRDDIPRKVARTVEDGP